MYNRFTERARRVLALAKEEARRLGHDFVGTEHIILGILREGSGGALAVLQRMNMHADLLREATEEITGKGPSVLNFGEISFTPKARRVLELAMEESRNLGHSYVGTEHLLLGILREKEGIGAQILGDLGITIEKVREEIIRIQGGFISSASAYDSRSSAGSGQEPGRNEFFNKAQQQKKVKTSALDVFGRDITELARENKLDPIIGRKKEIERILQILCRRKKNNPVLIGDAGVGKTAIVEGLAQEIVQKNVPEALMFKRIIALDLALMVAGTKYRGQFEERIKAVLNEIRQDSNIIIFIDEIHTLVGAGAAEGAIDASNILKPSLARGEMHCIGATTPSEYRKYIEKDPALERRFQPIIVHPPSVDETVEILKGLKTKYENHHKVIIPDASLWAAALFSERYISERFLPDKAIDVMDEACSKTKLFKKNPKNIDLQTEKKLSAVQKDKNDAVRLQDFEKAAQLRDKERTLKEQMELKRRVVVDVQDIAEVVSKWTGVPLQQLQQEETTRLLNMEESIHKRVIGQNEAVVSLAKTIRRSRSGLKDPKRPIGVFVFLGPTGVGKTELAKALAEFLFGSEDALIRLDMSEFMEKFAVSRLVGAPPGYVGYEEGGELTEKVRRKPYSVVLLDEIEKAHPDVFNILLQVMEDGRLTDNLNHTVDFRNVVLIMTSNIGSETLIKGSTLGFQSHSDRAADYQQMKTKLTDELKRTFKPEFLNRIDEVIVFHSLAKDDLKQIVDIMLEKVKVRLQEYKLDLKHTSEVSEFLIEKGYDKIYGARPLRRAIQKFIEDPLAEKILKGEISRGSSVEICVENNELKFISKAPIKKIVRVQRQNQNNANTRRRAQGSGKKPLIIT
ncbi:MAG: ATP-dependent Clp protease ATP-binding subunit [Candidatus Ratteibacteria bacterium]|nr:ATP-dependent Clp protease ATP-binding subunit [Candidatus Ratteibacteria bacterium]